MNEDFENQNFPQFLIERMKERGWNAKRLSEVSGISLKHIEEFLKGNFSALPATPYLHGYLERLSRVFDFDHEKWWSKIKAENDIKDSGAADRLPQNRFLKKPRSKFIWLGVLAAAALVYLGFRFAPIFGKPVLNISSPESNFVTAFSNELVLSGRVGNADEVLVDGEAVAISPDGSWTKNVTLQPGLNTVEITAKKFLGGETSSVKQILYQPASSSASSTIFQ